MACQAWFAAQNITPDNIVSQTPSVLIKAVYDEGVGCLNANLSFCENFCTSSTLNPAACYACLGNYVTCPSSTGGCRIKTLDCKKTPSEPCCSDAKGSCCPVAQAAIECGACLAANGNHGTIDDFLACNQSHELSSTTIIIIVVSCVVAVILLGASLFMVYRLRKNAGARDRLVQRLGASGVNQNLVNTVANLNYSDINADIYRQVNRDLVLQARPADPGF